MFVNSYWLTRRYLIFVDCAYIVCGCKIFRKGGGGREGGGGPLPPVKCRRIKRDKASKRACILKRKEAR